MTSSFFKLSICFVLEVNVSADTTGLSISPCLSTVSFRTSDSWSGFGGKKLINPIIIIRVSCSSGIDYMWEYCTDLNQIYWRVGEAILEEYVRIYWVPALTFLGRCWPLHMSLFTISWAELLVICVCVCVRENREGDVVNDHARTHEFGASGRTHSHLPSLVFLQLHPILCRNAE